MDGGATPKETEQIININFTKSISSKDRDDELLSWFNPNLATWVSSVSNAPPEKKTEMVKKSYNDFLSAVSNINDFVNAWKRYFDSYIINIENYARGYKKDIRPYISKIESKNKEFYNGYPDVKNSMNKKLTRINDGDVNAVKELADELKLFKSRNLSQWYYGTFCPIMNAIEFVQTGKTPTFSSVSEFSSFCKNLSEMQLPGFISEIPPINDKPPDIDVESMAKILMTALGKSYKEVPKTSKLHMDRKYLILITAVVVVVLILIVAVVVFTVMKKSRESGESGESPEFFTNRALHVEHIDVNGPDLIQMGQSVGMDMPAAMLSQNNENRAFVANAIAKREESKRVNSDRTGSNTRGRDVKQMISLLGSRLRMDNSRGAKEHFVDCPCGCNNYMA